MHQVDKAIKVSLQVLILEDIMRKGSICILSEYVEILRTAFIHKVNELGELGEIEIF